MKEKLKPVTNYIRREVKPIKINRNLQDSISLDHVLAVLNEATEMDPDAMKVLITTRTPCNQKLSNHPTIQIAVEKIDDITLHMVGTLGLLNGLFGASTTGWGPICSVFQLTCINRHEPSEGTSGNQCPECGAILFPGRLLRFIRTPDKYLHEEVEK